MRRTNRRLARGRLHRASSVVGCSLKTPMPITTWAGPASPMAARRGEVGLSPGPGAEPDHLDARLNLGSLHEELGAMAEAEACYREAEPRHPHSPLAAGPASDVGPRPTAQAETATSSVLSFIGPMARTSHEPAVRPGPRADARGDHAEAAACLEPANALARDCASDCGQTYDADEHTRYVDRLIAGFTPEVFDRLAGAGDDSAAAGVRLRPAASGTTLVEQMLASHSRVLAPANCALGRRAMDDLPGVGGPARRT